MPTLALLSLLLTAAPPRTVEDALPAFSKAYGVAFDRLKTVELSDTQTRITRLGAAGTRFQADLDALRKRQGEVSDLLVKAVEAKQQGQRDHRAQAVDDATKLLADADGRAQRLAADVKRLNEQLTAAGAPVIDPGPARDPNARD